MDLINIPEPKMVLQFLRIWLSIWMVIKKLLSMNTKALNTLYSALSKSNFNRITSCKNARDIWHALEITHEKTNQVKKSKIEMLVHQYELFKMRLNEFITGMFTRMTTMTNSLYDLGRTNMNSNIMSKTLRSLPKTCDAKVMAIQKANDLTKLPLE
jgi:uncharacterized protein YjgD (DUF1641 family)